MNSSIEQDNQDKQNVNNDNNDFDEPFVEEEPFPSSSAYDQYTDNLSQVEINYKSQQKQQQNVYLEITVL